VGKLRIGVDVPWVTSWSGEQVLGDGPCPSIDGGLAVGQALKPGAGQPQWPSNHLFRQRKSVREMLCPMCGKPTPEGDRWSQTARPTTGAEVRAKGLGAWLHRICAERARTECPHLAALPDQGLKAFPPAWIVVPLTVEARPSAAHANVPQRGIAAVTFLQLLGVPDRKTS
jgi:hypothetical protein